jgi:tRNA A-37 threonylcarbamoyl transferase component Bud32
MHEMKDTPRALVRISFDGRVHKTFRGHMAKERFEQEVRVLQYLEKRGCTFVPRLLDVFPAELKIITTNCGTRVDQLNPQRQAQVYAELEQFGVRHEDREMRNITYRTSDGRFCVIDFEFATILGDGRDAVSLKPSAAQ